MVRFMKRDLEQDFSREKAPRISPDFHFHVPIFPIRRETRSRGRTSFPSDQDLQQRNGLGKAVPPGQRIGTGRTDRAIARGIGTDLPAFEKFLGYPTA